MRFRRRVIACAIGVVACGGGAAPGPHVAAPPSGPVAAVDHPAASPAGGWTAPGTSLGPMILCVIDNGFGITKKRASKAARIAADKGCTLASDGTGHCGGGHGMHAEFDLTWKLVGDELTLDPPSDLVHGPVTFKRDPAIDCTPEPARDEPDAF